MLSKTFSTSSKPPESFDVKELVAMLDKAGEPQGVVLLPNGSGFDVFQFPSVLLKGAISLMHCNLEPKTHLTTAPCCKG